MTEGPPPCQNPDCELDSNYRTGHTYCLGHEGIDGFGIDNIGGKRLSTQGIALPDGEFTVFFGCSCGSSRKTLRQMEEPNVCISYGTRSKSTWDGIESLFVDSGGYSLIEKGEGSYPDSIDDYLDYVDSSGADWFVTRDMPATDGVIEAVGEGRFAPVDLTIELTRATLDAYERREIDAVPVSVIQGTTPLEYRRCTQQLVDHDLVTSRMAIGSLKHRSSYETSEIIESISEVVPHGVELHGMGIDVPQLKYDVVKNNLTSIDTGRYIATAGWRGVRDEYAPRLRDDEPKAGWLETARAYLDMREELREVLAPEQTESDREDVSQATLPTDD